MSATLFFVEHQSHQATVIEVVVRLLGLEPSPFLTAEGALRAVEERAPDFLLTDLILPGRSGLDLIQGTKERAPQSFCVLLSSVPPGLSPNAAARFGVDATIVRRGPWATQLGAALGLTPEPKPARVLSLIDRGEAGFDELAVLAERDPLALRYLAAAFDPERVLAIVERAGVHAVALDLAMVLGGAGFGVVERIATSTEAAPETRGRAMRHLSRSFPHSAVMPVLQVNLQDASTLIRLDAAHAAFESAARVGEQGLATLREIAEADSLPDALRISALQQVARTVPRAQVKSVLVRALESDRPTIVHAASALVMRGDGLDVEALTSRASSGALDQRCAALERLAADFPKEAVLPILIHFQTDPDAGIRRCAYELTMSRADTGFEETLARASAEGSIMLQAALQGALRLGAAGFAAIAAIARDESTEPISSIIAIRLLGVRFSAALAGPVLAELSGGDRFEPAGAALLAAVQLGPAGFAVLKTAQSSAPIPAVRELALIYLEEYAPDPVFKPALQRALRDPENAVRARAIELWMRRLGGEFAPLLSRLARSGQRPLQEAGLDGALALGEGGFTAIAAFASESALHPMVQRRAREALLARFPSEETTPILNRLEAPTEPATPATKPASQLASSVEAWEVAITKPVAPAVASRDLEARVRKALEAAILQGRQGYKAIRAIADSRRVPDELRVRALRRLAADFPDGDVAPVLEKALSDRSFEVQYAALGCAMLRKDTAFEPVARIALEGATDLSLRIRAVRFLAARFDKETVRPILETLFEDPHPRVRWAALECTFTSLKFVHPDRVEEHLINLLTEHHSAEAKIAAAKALGVFGSEAALQALVRFTGRFAEGAVREAAQDAASRIRERLIG